MVFSHFLSENLEKHKIFLFFCAFSHFSHPFRAQPSTPDGLQDGIGIGVGRRRVGGGLGWEKVRKMRKNAKMRKKTRKPYIFQGFRSENAKKQCFTQDLEGFV